MNWQPIDARIRPGTLANCGDTIGGLAGPAMREFAQRVGRERRSSDCRATCAIFSKQTGVDRVVVVNVASTEPRQRHVELPERWDDLSKRIDDSIVRLTSRQLAVRDRRARSGHAVHQFHAVARRRRRAAIQELAVQRKTCHAGQDGKTGETLLKSVLAPMFAARNLEVLSWVGHNIFGNLDGLVLDDPANKAAKIKSKDQLVGNILGYDPQTLVSIEYIRSLGDWKTAWDHIHFRGFLGTPMTLQFIWQGCDSLLAAPLVLDLVRFVELSHRRGEVGVLEPSGQFFQAAAGSRETRFFPAIFAAFGVGRATLAVPAQPSRSNAR